MSNDSPALLLGVDIGGVKLSASVRAANGRILAAQLDLKSFAELMQRAQSSAN